MAVVTLTTDFGTADAYAGAMKGVVLSLAPDAVVIDITHEIPRHDVKAGALALAHSAPYFPTGSVHVAVVDPGVGGDRAAIVIEAGGRLLVGPDNGLLSLAAVHPRRSFAIQNPLFRREPVSPTFHGRDVFAVAAGRLANGTPAAEAGPPWPTLVNLPWPEATPLGDDCQGEIVHVDRFGNLLTSLVADNVTGRWQLECAGRIFHLDGGRTFADVSRGSLVLYPGSSGRVEIAVRDASAAALTGALTGITIRLRRLR